MQFEEIYRQHAPAVFRFALSVTRRKDIAEDLTSDAFLMLYRHQTAIDPAQLPAWLITVVRNRARDLWRHRIVEERYVQSTPADEAAGGEPALESWLLDSADLKPVHRACVTLRYVYGMTRPEVAARMGLSETQVKGHLQYALKLLRKAHKVPA